MPTSHLCRASCVLLTGLFSLPAFAHEFWLQPETFRVAAGEPLKIDIRIGQGFKGDSFAYLPSQVESIKIHRGDAVVPVTPRLGDYPAITHAALGEGLNVVTLSSYSFSLTYREPGKFAQFARSEGLDWVLDRHRARGLPDVDFVEAYRRNAKTLVQVGSGDGQDRRTGLEFEWVMLSNPYADSGDELTAQLWWRDGVLADSQARLFIRQDGKAEEILLRTDEDGRVELPRRAGASYLLNAVRIMEPERAAIDEHGAVWESRWASVTFATGE